MVKKFSGQLQIHMQSMGKCMHSEAGNRSEYQKIYPARSLCFVILSKIPLQSAELYSANPTVMYCRWCLLGSTPCKYPMVLMLVEVTYSSQPLLPGEPALGCSSPEPRTDKIICWKTIPTQISQREAASSVFVRVCSVYASCTLFHLSYMQEQVDVMLVLKTRCLAALPGKITFVLILYIES